MKEIIVAIYTFFASSPIIPIATVQDLNNGVDTAYNNRPVSGFVIGILIRW